jgi:hypothetical protein
MFKENHKTEFFSIFSVKITSKKTIFEQKDRSKEDIQR